MIRDQYIGAYLLFLRPVLPVIIILSVLSLVWLIVKSRDKGFAHVMHWWLFFTYIVTLLSLILFLNPISWLVKLIQTGEVTTLRFFTGKAYFVPDFYDHINYETVGNVLAFIPFGTLFMLTHKKATFARAVLASFALTLTVELLQPIFGRLLELNDIILNTVGGFIGAGIIVLIRLIKAKKRTS